MGPYTGVARLFLKLKVHSMASVTRDFTVRTVRVPVSNLHKQFLSRTRTYGRNSAKILQNYNVTSASNARARQRFRGILGVNLQPSATELACNGSVSIEQTECS